MGHHLNDEGQFVSDKYEVRRLPHELFVDEIVEHGVFVLKIDTDPNARRAAIEYAHRCEKDKPELSHDLIEACMNYAGIEDD